MSPNQTFVHNYWFLIIRITHGLLDTLKFKFKPNNSFDELFPFPIS